MQDIRYKQPQPGQIMNSTHTVDFRMRHMDTTITGGAPFTQAKQVFIIYLKGTACSSAA